MRSEKRYTQRAFLRDVLLWTRGWGVSLRKDFVHGCMSYQFPNQILGAKQAPSISSGSHTAVIPDVNAPYRIGTSGSSMQIQNPLLLFALDDAQAVVLHCGEKVIQGGKRSQSIRTPDLRFNLSEQVFGIIAVASSALPASCETIWEKVRNFFGSAAKSDATLFSISIFPPGPGSAPAVLALVVPADSEYPDILNEVCRTPAGIRMAIGTLLNAAHSNNASVNPVVLDIAECLREATFGPAARASAMLPANYPWSEIAPQVREASLDRFRVFNVSTADGVYKLKETVKRVSLVPVRRAA